MQLWIVAWVAKALRAEHFRFSTNVVVDSSVAITCYNFCAVTLRRRYCLAELSKVLLPHVVFVPSVRRIRVEESRLASINSQLQTTDSFGYGFESEN